MQNKNRYSKICLYFPESEEEIFKCIEAFKHKKTQFISLLIKDYIKRCNISSYTELTEQKIKLMINDLQLHGSQNANNNIPSELIASLLQQLNNQPVKESVNNSMKETNVSKDKEPNKCSEDYESNIEIDNSDEIDYSTIDKQSTLDSLSAFY